MMTTLIKVYGKGSPCTDQVGGRALSLILQTEEIDADVYIMKSDYDSGDFMMDLMIEVVSRIWLSKSQPVNDMIVKNLQQD